MRANTKVKTLEAMASMAELARGRGQKVALCHGCFDILHVGHIWHFMAVKDLADLLLVTITADKYISKGAGRPVFVQEQRAFVIAALSCVDAVAVSEFPTGVMAIETICPDLYVKGAGYLRDYASGGDLSLIAEADAVARHGGRIEFTATPEFHSTDLIPYLKECV